MKTFFKMIGAITLLTGMLLVGGCGHDTEPVPQGKVVKGPVVGAKVFDADGVQIGTTDVNGNFPMITKGPYTTIGGTYIPFKADGTAGTPIPAPPMSAPIGVSQITPLSTLVQTATASGNTIELNNLLSVINKNGGLYVDLSKKTDTNAALLNLSETVGAVLATVNNTPSVTSAQTTIIKSALIAAIGTLPNNAVMTPALIVSNVVNSDILGSALGSIKDEVQSAAIVAANGTNNAPSGSLPTYTGSTGGSN